MNEANLEAYRQAFQTVRHFSQLRFAVLAVFASLTTGLVAIASGRGSAVVNAPGVIPNVLGMLLALVFGITEWRMNEIMEFYAAKIVALGTILELSSEAASLPPKSMFWRRSDPALTLLVYAAAVIVWIAAALMRK
jgi:hypothetical protein